MKCMLDFSALSCANEHASSVTGAFCPVKGTGRGHTIRTFARKCETGLRRPRSRHVFVPVGGRQPPPPPPPPPLGAAGGRCARGMMKAAWQAAARPSLAPNRAVALGHHRPAYPHAARATAAVYVRWPERQNRAGRAHPDRVRLAACPARVAVAETVCLHADSGSDEVRPPARRTGSYGIFRAL